jgi:hypothetical protein
MVIPPGWNRALGNPEEEGTESAADCRLMDVQEIKAGIQANSTSTLATKQQL